MCARCSLGAADVLARAVTLGHDAQPLGQRRHGALDAVVEADLEPTALFVGREHEPPPWSLQLVELRLHVGRQGGVGRRQPRRRRHRVDECRLVEDRRVVDQHGERPRLAFDERRHALATTVRRVHRSTVHVQVLAVRRPVADLQRRVAESV